MKLNKDFLLHNIGTESVLVPLGKADFSGVVRGNRTFRAVLELLQTDTTEEKIILTLRSRYDAPEGAIEKDVAKVLAELRKIGALDIR